MDLMFDAAFRSANQSSLSLSLVCAHSNYAEHKSARYAKFHVLSFVSEFLCISGLFVSFLLIALIGKKTDEEERAGGGRAEKEQPSGGEGKQGEDEVDLGV